MSELKDLRGCEIEWQLTKRNPLRCAISIHPDDRGSLVQDSRRAPVRAALAGVWWDLETVKGRDSVCFAESRLVVATAEQRQGQPYTAWIDGVAEYRLQREPDLTRISWVDAEGKRMVIFRRHRLSIRGYLGAIIVRSDMVVEHAPILILLGLRRMGRKLLFADTGWK